MDINDLTIGEAKQIASFFNSAIPSSSLLDGMAGKYVLVRSRNEGVNAGYIVKADDTGIILKDARRIWYHKPKDKKLAWYEGVAISGLGDDSKISAPVVEKAIIEDYSITACTEEAKKSIVEYKSYAQG